MKQRARRSRSRGVPGPPGPAGPTGPRGPKGTRGERGGGSHAELVGGEAATEIIERLSDEVVEIHGDLAGIHQALETQLTRIAQIQHQLDELRGRLNAGTASRPTQ